MFSGSQSGLPNLSAENQRLSIQGPQVMNSGENFDFFGAISGHSNHFGGVFKGLSDSAVGQLSGEDRNSIVSTVSQRSAMIRSQPPSHWSRSVNRSALFANKRWRGNQISLDKLSC